MKKINYTLLTSLILLSTVGWAQEASEASTRVYENLAYMKPCYKGEELTPAQPTCLVHHSFTVKYFDLNNPEDVAAREEYHVVIQDGKVRKASATNEILDAEGKKNYVLGQDGKLFIFDEKLVEEVRHSSFYVGEAVAAAGNLKLKHGQIVEINDKSGHYETTEESLKNMYDYLSANGMKLNE